MLPEIGLLQLGEVDVERIAEVNGGEARQHRAERQQRHDAPNSEVHGFHAANHARENTHHHHPVSALASVRGGLFRPHPKLAAAAT
jgi:ABC-type Zn2+ transport system substrate-binding protein/surface adhesin